MNKSLKKLKWDSQFFGFNVYNLFSNNNEDIINIFKEIDEPSLTYIFSKNRIPEEILSKFNGLLVDSKIVLSKNIIKLRNEEINDIKQYQFKSPNKELYDLALESGKYSRFKIDKRLPKGSFERLYRLWIEKACRDTTTKLFVSMNKNIVEAFVTVDVFAEENYGKIGLIAVNPEIQNRGLGSKLIKKVEQYIYLKGIKVLKVPTQLQNKKAVKFYERNGFEIENLQYVYHFISN